MLWHPLVLCISQLLDFGLATSQQRGSLPKCSPSQNDNRLDHSRPVGSGPHDLAMDLDEPADSAEIAGVMTSTWSLHNDCSLLVVINEYNKRRLVRQNACFRTHQESSPKTEYLVRNVRATLIFLLFLANCTIDRLYRPIRVPQNWRRAYI